MPLTRDQVVAAAVRLVDEEGASRLSMRRLGDALGTGAATVYWHVPGKDALLDLVADRVLAEAFEDFAGGTDWRTYAQGAALALRATARRHPGVAPILARRPPLGPAAIGAASGLLELLRADGFDARSAVLASTTIVTWGIAAATIAAAPDAPGEPAGTARRAVAADPASIAGVLADLAPDAPVLADVARDVAGLDAEDPFAYGLAALLDGIEARERRRRAGGRAGPGATTTG